MDERYLSESSVIHAIGDIHPLDYNGQGIVERIKAIPAADVKPINPADRCSIQFKCCMDYDGKACRAARDTEPTNADRIRSMTDEEMAEIAKVNKGIRNYHATPELIKMYATLELKEDL